MESYQKITLTVPSYVTIPPEITTFSHDENALLLLIGMNAVAIVKNEYVNKDQEKRNEEIAQKIRDTYLQIVHEKDRKYQELEELNHSLKQAFEDASVKTMTNYCDKIQDKIQGENTKLSAFYEKQLENVNTELKRYQEKNYGLNEELLHYRERVATLQESRDLAEREHHKQVELEKLRLIKQTALEYEPIVAKLREELMATKLSHHEYVVNMEHEKNQKTEVLLQESLTMMGELKKQKNASNISKGLEGEMYAYNLFMDIFHDFEDFDIKHTASTPHSADMVMKFKNFSILVDSKNYSNGVDKKEIVKLEKDCANNQHINVAWLVSLNTPINGFSKYPVMYEIKDNVCYCYINSLSKHENPKQFIRTIWYSCNFLFEKVLNVGGDDVLINKYMKNEERIKLLVEKMMKRSKERYATLKQLTENFDETDQDLREILTGEVISVHEMCVGAIKTWWDKHIVVVLDETGSSLKTKKMWEAFSKEEHAFSVHLEVFKQVIRDMVDPGNVVGGGKTGRGDYTIMGVKMV